MTEDAKVLETKLVNFGLNSTQQKGVLGFYKLLRDENTRQNLTRLIAPDDFWNGHCLDVFELLKLSCVTYPAVDLGSGCGVPGLLAAVIEPKPWILVESEKRKAEFLNNAVKVLELEALVQVSADRIENYIKRNSAQSVIARAVGPVDRIISWLCKSSNSCSTWNNLILFKGPNWDEEWEKFSKSPASRGLIIELAHEYKVGPEEKVRKIVKIVRSGEK